MTLRRLWMLVGIVLAMTVAACAGVGQKDRERVPPGDPVISLLSKGVDQLNINIEALSKRMKDVQKDSPGTDPALQEMKTLDLSGWQLHQQQWMLQRNHLILARNVLQRAHLSPGEKGKLLNQWRQHQQEYVNSLEELRQQRHVLENQHLEVETRMIERGLQ